MTLTSRILLVLDAPTAIALADDDGDGVPDPGVLEEAAGAAERHVIAEAAIGGLSVEPPLAGELADIATTLAVRALFERRPNTLPPAWRERTDRARRLLLDIRLGRRRPHDFPHAPRIHGTETRPPLHTPDNLDGY